MARLRGALEAAPPSVTVVEGPAGVGKTGVVREALRGLQGVVRYWAAPLADADHRARLVGRLQPWLSRAEGAARPGALPADALSAGSEWRPLFERLAEAASGRAHPLRLVLEEFPRLVEARSKLPEEVERFWRAVRARALPVHLVLTGGTGKVSGALGGEAGPFAAWTGTRLTLPPLDVREVAAMFPSWSLRDRFLAWAIFGGLPHHLRACDPGASLATNVRQALLSPEAPLLLEGVTRLREELQSPARYATLLGALAEGRREWGEVLAAVPDFTAGSQMAPYLAKLQAMGWVEAEASLDAAAGSRSRRYRPADPFLGFWYRFVLPSLSDLVDGRERDVWRERIRPRLDDHAARWFAVACRDHLLRHGDTLGATAREAGGLWGPDYDIELAGTLRTGAAFYGRAFWGGGRIPETADAVLHEEVRRTRYGFGREARIRVIFATDGFAPALLRRAARTDGLRLLSPRDLVGARAPDRGPGG